MGGQDSGHDSGMGRVVHSLRSAAASGVGLSAAQVSALLGSMGGVGNVESWRSGWHNHLLPFVRDEGMRGITTIAMLSVWSVHSSPEKALEALQSGVTAWVCETDEGRAAWASSSEDLNIGDLMLQDWSEGSALGGLLRRSGVLIEAAAMPDAEGATPFDRVLVDARDARLRTDGGEG